MAVKIGDNNANIIEGTAFADVLQGLGGNDTLRGLASGDVLLGGTGADLVYGGDGNDVLQVGDGDTAIGEIYSGGNGIDVLKISSAVAPVVGAFSVSFFVSSIYSIESLDFFNGGQPVFASFAASSFGGRGFAAALGVNGGSGADHIAISMGSDNTLDLSGLTFTNWSVDDRIAINGDASGETVTGSSRTDVIFGSSGTDTITAGAGNDVMNVNGTTAGDRYGGGTGFDVLLTSVNETDLQSAALTGIEGIAFAENASSNGSVLIFSADQFGGSGVSTGLQITGGPSDLEDVKIVMGIRTAFDASNFSFVNFLEFDSIQIFGDADDETIFGSSRNNEIFGGGGDDVLVGGDSRDFIRGGTGADAMFGGAGSDIYYIDNVGDSAEENLTGPDPGESDQVETKVTTTLGAFIEYLDLDDGFTINGTGNGLDNLLEGNDRANVLSGLRGDDDLFGSEGADTLIGGGGADELNGGDGNDRFTFRRTVDSSVGFFDTVLDFETGDRIDVSQIDANTALAGNQAFVLDTGGQFTAGEFRITAGIQNSSVSFNTDADATSEMLISVQNVTNLGAADLIL